MQLTPAQKEFIRVHAHDDVRDLALRKQTAVPAEDMPFLLAQIVGRQTAKHKIPSWYDNDAIIYPVHLSMEQASSEATARYKATLITHENHHRFVDLTGGLGVDFAFLSPNFQEAIYVEQNKMLCKLAAYNFNVLGLKNSAIKNEESETFLHKMPKADVIYLDPARRDNHGRKVFRINDCSPDVITIKEDLLTRADVIIVKFSPMLDISAALQELTNVAEVHIVSVENACKELLFVLRKVSSTTHYIAVNLLKNNQKDTFPFTLEDEKKSSPIYASTVETYLYEPNASILKAGAFNSIAEKFGIKKLHPHTHLYTSEKYIPDFPGRIFRIENIFSPNKANLKLFLGTTDKANLAVRNFPMSVAEIRKKTGLQDGGNKYIFATTLTHNKRVWIVCEKSCI